MTTTMKRRHAMAATAALAITPPALTGATFADCPATVAELAPFAEPDAGTDDIDVSIWLTVNLDRYAEAIRHGR